MTFMIDLIFTMIFVIEKNRVDLKLPKIKKKRQFGYPNMTCLDN